MILQSCTEIMKPQEDGLMPLDIGSTSFNPKDAITWIERQETSSQLVLVFILSSLYIHHAHD